MMRSIEVVYDGKLDQSVIDYLTRDLGVLVEQIRPLLVRTATPRRDVPAVIGAAKLIPGLQHIWIRRPHESTALAAGTTE